MVSTWEIRLGVHTTEAQARALVERIKHLLCEDPDHAPPCPIPWQIAFFATEDDPTLAEQYRIEHG